MNICQFAVKYGLTGAYNTQYGWLGKSVQGKRGDISVIRGNFCFTIQRAHMDDTSKEIERGNKKFPLRQRVPRTFKVPAKFKEIHSGPPRYQFDPKDAKQVAEVLELIQPMNGSELCAFQQRCIDTEG